MTEKYNIFFSWQSENSRPKTILKKIVDDAIVELKKKFQIEYSYFPCDGYAGSPDIKKVVEEKIRLCDVFIADLSESKCKCECMCVKNKCDDRIRSNSNVCYELGYASSVLNDENIIIFVDFEPEKLFFDVKTHRVSQYKNNSKDIVKFIEFSIDNVTNNRIYERYDYRCLFCLEKYQVKELSIEHSDNKTINTVICKFCKKKMSKLDIYCENDFRIDDGSKLNVEKMYNRLIEENVYNSDMANVKLFFDIIHQKKETTDNEENVYNDATISGEQECIKEILSIKKENVDHFNISDHTKMKKIKDIIYNFKIYDKCDNKDRDFVIDMMTNDIYMGTCYDYIEFFISSILYIFLEDEDKIDNLWCEFYYKLMLNIYRKYGFNVRKLKKSKICSYIASVVSNLCVTKYYDNMNTIDAIYLFETYTLCYGISSDNHKQKILNELYHIEYKNFEKNIMINNKSVVFDDIVVQVVEFGEWISHSDTNQYGYDSFDKIDKKYQFFDFHIDLSNVLRNVICKMTFE